MKERFADKGEPPIYWHRLSSFPNDARHVLHIRAEVQEELNRRGGKRGPVDDLRIEEGRADLLAEGQQVVHPITFVLPNAVLRLLSHIDVSQRVEFP